MQLNSLLSKLQTLEMKHKQTPSESIGKELDTTRKQITDLLQYKAKAALQICRRKIYESGNKCGRLLAQTLRSQKLTSYIPYINSSRGEKLSLPQHISQEFRLFYNSLYNLDMPLPNRDATSEYLTALHLPTLLSEARDLLEEPITLSELQIAIGNTKTGKAPGPDGLTITYYKNLLPSLGNHMIKLFNASILRQNYITPHYKHRYL